MARHDGSVVQRWHWASEQGQIAGQASCVAQQQLDRRQESADGPDERSGHHLVHMIAGPDSVAALSRAVEQDGWAFITRQMPLSGTATDSPCPTASMGSQRGEPARSQDVLRAWIPQGAAQLRDTAIAEPPPGTSTRTRLAASGRPDLGRVCPFRVDSSRSTKLRGDRCTELPRTPLRLK